MNFIILIVAIIIGYFVWKLISRYFINNGYRKLTSNFAGVSIAFLSFLLTIGILAPTPNKSQEIKNSVIVKNENKKPVIHKYTIVNNRDYSFRGRKRLGWTITSPSAITKEDRAVTVMQAAKDLQQKTNADQVEIFLVIDGLDSAHGMPLAVVAYTPDGKGNSGNIDAPIWEVEVSEQNLTQLEKDITLSWYKHKQKFIKSDGLTDEKGLENAVSKELNIPVGQVNLPWIKRIKMDYN